MKISTKTQRLTASGLCLALGLILPYVCAHGLGLAGTVLLPMHIPVLLCGFLCGPFHGGICGLILPLLNSVLTGMPTMFPMVLIMTAELFTYGTVAGTLYFKTPLSKHKWGIYIALPCAMLSGRAAYGLTFTALMLTSSSLRAPTVFAAIITGLPGIAIQLLVMPVAILAVNGASGIQDKNAIGSAKNLIARDKATCVVIKDSKIVSIEHGRGIKPILKMYEHGLLQNAIVVDKIVGKAAAMIMVLGGASQCMGRTVSMGALEVFRKYGIPCEYDECPERIINRAGNGICPMEAAVEQIDNPNDAISAIREKLNELSKKE